VLGGSYARGNATPYSDVDIVHFVTVAPANPHRSYRYIEGRLVSIATRTLDWYRTALTQPTRAIFAMPAMQEARILLDKDGVFRAFQQELEAFTWEPLQASANQHVSHMLMNSAEDVHKLLSAQIRNDAPATFSTATTLYFDLTLAVVVQRGRLIDGSRTYVQHAQDAAGMDSAWTYAHQQFTSLDTYPSPSPIAQRRTQAALELYRETVALLEPALQPDHRVVVEHTVQLINTGF